jgi:hypothetical protein
MFQHVSTFTRSLENEAAETFHRSTFEKPKVGPDAPGRSTPQLVGGLEHFLFSEHFLFFEHFLFSHIYIHNIYIYIGNNIPN